MNAPSIPPSTPRRLTVLLAVLALVVGGDAARAQGLGRLAAGDSVRLRLPGALRVDAAMTEIRGDTLMLRVQGVVGIWPVAGSDLASLERYARRTPREGFRHGAVLGMVSGLFAGAALGVAVNLAADHEGDDPAAEFLRSALSWSGLGAVFGGIGGGFIGGARPGSGWVALELPGR